MGLISWIKNKYNESRFQKASRLLSEGKTSYAIELLKEILPQHRKAPSTLLFIYHNQIKEKRNNVIQDVSVLYDGYNELKDEIISFASEISNSLPEIATEYSDALFSKGIKELENTFVTVGTKLVLQNSYIDSLDKLSNKIVLLNALSESLFAEAKKIYHNSQLSSAERICILISPYLNSKDFYELYANVRFDLISHNQITASTINELDILIKDIKTTYNLSNSSIKKLTDKGFEKATERFNANDFIASLLISQRLIDKYSDAKKIYGDSALKLYYSSPKNNLVVPEILYKSLGDNDSDVLVALEAFIPYGNHKNKYLELASLELKRLMLINVEQATSLFHRVWRFIQDEILIETIMSYGNDSNKSYATIFLISNYSEIITQDNYFRTLIQSLLNLEDVDFIVSTLEAFLKKGKKVEKEFVSQIKRQAEAAKAKSKERVEIIEHGLSIYKCEELFVLQGSYLNDYIDCGIYDEEYAFNIALSLKGKSLLSEILQAKILIDEAKKSNDLSIKEQKLKLALGFKNSHDKLFDIVSYQNILPIIESLLLETASRYFKLERQHATEIFYLLRDNGLNWYERYAQLNLDTISENEPKLDDATFLLTIINEGSDFNYLIKEYLWSKYVEIHISLLSKTDLDGNIGGLSKLKDELKCQCSSSNKETLINSINKLLSKKYLARGKHLEKNNDFSNAISDYEKIISLSGEYPDIQSRVVICKIKSGNKITKTDIALINKLLSTDKNKDYQRDLAFRWCLYLISNNQLEQADELNQRILGGDSEISQICLEEKIKLQQGILDKLNNNINKLNNSELSPEEALDLGKSLTKIFDKINLIVKVSSQKASTLKDALRIYAIEKFYENEDYLKCISGLKVQDSAYLSDPIALRNIAIMCLGAAEAGMLTKDNYKEFLAIWATAIYQQKIFVDSLDYTSWDDPYTFSLDGALGQLDNNYEELSDNINYSDSSEPKVVSIREVQKNLLSRMESAIKDNSEYQQFLSSQLVAMDKLSEQNLDEQCVIVAPYLLTLSPKYQSNVSRALSIEEQGHYENWETILEIGYLYGLNTGIFGTYTQALDYQKKAVDSIRNKKQITRSFAATRIRAIRQFEGLMTDLVAAITTSLNEVISNEIDYKNLANTYGTIIKIVGDESLAFVFSNYINQQIVKRLKDKTLSLSQGASILFEIYDYCKCNPHLKRNLDNIIEALIHNFITDGDNNNLILLDKVLSSTHEFDQQVVSALKGGNDVPDEMMTILFSSNMERFNSLKARISSKSNIIQRQFNETSNKIAQLKVIVELNEIIDKVNNETMSKKNALEKVYTIYRNNKNNIRVCENLSALIPMCIMEYVIPNKYGKAGVENVLDLLKSNISSTFRAHNSEIRNAYNLIWGKLPHNAKSAIENQPWNLNDDGRALKKGLDYLKALS